MKNIILSIFVIFLTFTSATAQIDSTITNQPFKHAVGVTVGFTIGSGLSYRYSVDKFGIQVSFLPLKEETRSRYTVGLSFFYKLVQSEKVDFFMYQGNQYLYKSDADIYSGENTKTDLIESYLNNGIGVGIRFIILKRVGLDIMGGYAGYKNFSKISFSGEMGLHFLF